MVEEYYDNVVNYEWRRLVKDAWHMLEFETTILFLKKYLPSTGFILDAGGGPGRYTIELAKRGYDVVLLDLSDENLKFAKQQIEKHNVRDKVRKIIIRRYKRFIYVS